MDQKVNETEWQNYVFDVGDWVGHEVYIEFLPGSYVRHNYRQERDAYIEVAYATAFDGEWFYPEEGSPYSPVSSLSQAVNRYNQGTISAADVGVLNQQLKAGKLKRHFPESRKTSLGMDLLMAKIRDTVFIQGVSEGFARESPVFIRGNHMETGEQPVPRAFLPEILEGQDPMPDSGSGRKEMVKIVLDPDNPLTARVMVNRLWHHVFGKGLVETVDNFGLQGKLPSHPALLDYLAVTFRQEGWSLKSMIKAMVMTDAFRRSTETVNESRDPENKYLSHYPIRRMEAEAIRDAMLFASGELDESLFGKPVPVHLTDFMQGRGRPGQSGPLDGNGRRSIYLEVRRNFLDRMMTTFDRPTPFNTFGKRDVTNVPAQSLFLMNDPFVVEQAGNMARRILADKTHSTEERIREAYFRAFSRPPSASEITEGKKFLASVPVSREARGGVEADTTGIQAWKEYCHALFNMKSFIYLL